MAKQIYGELLNKTISVDLFVKTKHEEKCINGNLCPQVESHSEHAGYLEVCLIK